MNQADLVALRDAINTLLAWPPAVLDEVARWLAPDAAKPNGRDPHPIGNGSGTIPEPPRPPPAPYGGKSKHGRPKNSAKTAERKLLAAMADNPNSTVIALANAAGSSRSGTGERLRMMALRGLVTNDLTGRWKLKVEEPRPPDPPQPSPS